DPDDVQVRRRDPAAQVRLPHEGAYPDQARLQEPQARHGDGGHQQLESRLLGRAGLQLVQRELVAPALTCPGPASAERERRTGTQEQRSPVSRAAGALQQVIAIVSPGSRVSFRSAAPRCTARDTHKSRYAKTSAAPYQDEETWRRRSSRTLTIAGHRVCGFRSCSPSSTSPARAHRRAPAIAPTIWWAARSNMGAGAASGTSWRCWTSS